MGTTTSDRKAKLMACKYNTGCPNDKLALPECGAKLALAVVQERAA